MTPNTPAGIKKANNRRNEAKKRGIKIAAAKRAAEKREPELIAERDRQRTDDFWEREAKRRRRRRDPRARRRAHSAWMQAGP